jgi:hypothetical protein
MIICHTVFQIQLNIEMIVKLMYYILPSKLNIVAYKKLIIVLIIRPVINLDKEQLVETDLK